MSARLSYLLARSYQTLATGTSSWTVVYRAVLRSTFIDHGLTTVPRSPWRAAVFPFHTAHLRDVADTSFVRSRDGLCHISTPSAKRSSSRWRIVSGCSFHEHHAGLCVAKSFADLPNAMERDAITPAPSAGRLSRVYAC